MKLSNTKMASHQTMCESTNQCSPDNGVQAPATPGPMCEGTPSPATNPETAHQVLGHKSGLLCSQPGQGAPSQKACLKQGPSAEKRLCVHLFCFHSLLCKSCVHDKLLETGVNNSAVSRRLEHGPRARLQQRKHQRLPCLQEVSL